MRHTVLWRRLLAEFLGSAFLAAVVIGSVSTPSFFSAAETFAKRALSAAAARKSSSLALIVA